VGADIEIRDGVHAGRFFELAQDYLVHPDSMLGAAV